MTTDARHAGRIFVSSTCYDLIDVRAVLAEALRDAGLEPVMSDRADSGFVNHGDANSIETCLVNLRSCERCIVILSQRYGPSLKSCRFDDISATHLEYRTAVQGGIPVLFYVRDRLEAECSLARKQPGEFKPLWAKAEDFDRLRGFVEEHRNLANDSRSNWFWTFTDASELCDRVVSDLGSVSGAARLKSLSRSGVLPVLGVSLMQALDAELRSWYCKLRVGGTASIGNVVAFGPSGEQLLRAAVMSPSDEADGVFTVDPHFLLMGGDSASTIRIEYDVADGARIVEYHAIVPDINNSRQVHAVPVGRACHGESARNSLPQVVQKGAITRAPWEYVNQLLGLGNPSAS